MGAVYLAERTDGELEQRVAIKVVRSHADLPAFQERFLRERRILASLNHPGIARLLDAGHTADAQPYLVMEFIDGVAIDRYCSQLDLRDILKLFLAVCEAVSYAHRNLIVHRDLKPSNILVDSAGRPKLLDFGIARILDASEDVRTVTRILTPEYASPEQMRGEAHSTATDIYSLGAVLQKLLAGEAPKASNSRAPSLSPMKPDVPQDIGRRRRRDWSFHWAVCCEPRAFYRRTAIPPSPSIGEQGVRHRCCDPQHPGHYQGPATDRIHLARIPAEGWRGGARGQGSGA
jgi:serine/threonine protein kinase